MRTFHDAKIMAKSLRKELADRQIDVSHSDCLELIARQFGMRDWNTFSALIERRPVLPLRLPEGWSLAGSAAQNYDMGVDSSQSHSQATIRCKFLPDDPEYARLEKGFGTLMQSIFADRFRGKTLRFAAKLKARAVSGAGTLWMRVERGPGQILRFDNMENRPLNGAICGDSDWMAREIVLDIPDEAMSIHYGFYLRGTGTLEIRDPVLEEAASNSVVTAAKHRCLDQPTNLAFRLG